MKQKPTRHSTLTENSAKVCKILRRATFHPHPGPISARSGRGGDLRIKITSENGRTRLRIAGGGVQEVFLYGTVDIGHLQKILSDGFGDQAIESIVSHNSG